MTAQTIVTSRQLALVWGLIATANSSVWAAEGTAKQQARQILDASGVQGGLVVQLGCGDGRLTAALRAGDSYLVHGLDKNPTNVAAARQHVQALGLYGPVSIESFSGDRLPYAENLVNLVVSEDLGNVSMEDVMRVLVPNGVAYLKNRGSWTKTTKPWPTGMDQWTHFLHGPDNNAVAHDRFVGPPRHIRWQGLPKFSRAHEQLASLNACVTAGGRMFYIIDETPRADIRLPSDWYLLARDAFNGVVLWKKPIKSWANQLRRFRSGPANLPFRVVADDDNVFVTLGFQAPVSVLDAATGRLVRTIERSASTKQIIHTNGMLVLLIDKYIAKVGEIDAARRRGQYIERQCRIAKAMVDTGKIVWETRVSELVFPCMALTGDRLFYQTPRTLRCTDFRTGKLLWSAPLVMDLPVRPNKLKTGETQWQAPTLVAKGEVVLVSDFKHVSAFSVADGERLWTSPSSKGYNSPPDILLIDELVWTAGRSNQRIGLDPATGRQQRTLSPNKGYMHPRCYRNKATDRFIMLGDSGVQFVDVRTGEAWRNHWIRGTCQYGIMPANGLLYVTPDSCACNMKTKLAGLYALASDRPTPAKKTIDERLETGPAFGKVKSVSPVTKENDWPTYRHDAMRSGMTDARVSAELRPAWQADLGGKLSSVVVADDRVFVASVDTHTVHALDASTGERAWTYTAGGRVNSPPSVYNHLVLFGSADGWVYALRASDGELVWRFRAAPEDRRVYVNGQLESVWPVHGSVLLKDNVVIAAAGRSSYLDGGIRVFRLNPTTGEMLSKTVIYSPDPETGKQPEDANRRDVRGVLSDILLADGDDVYMRHMKIDFETGRETGTGVHLFTPVGFLDDTWWHRTYWVVNDQFTSHWSGWNKVGNSAPSGRILSYDNSSIFGFGRDHYPGGNTGQWRGGEKYQLFALQRSAQPREQPKNTRRKNKKPQALNYSWTRRVPLLVKAMVVTDEALFIAGPPDLIKTRGTGGEALVLTNPREVLDAWLGKKGGVLWAVSAADGKKLAEYRLDAPPVFDGMAATSGRLYLSSADGKVLCFARR